LGTGDGNFQAPVYFQTGVRPRFVALGDLNGDGVPDLAVANQDSDNIAVLLGNGDGSFQTPTYFAVGIRPRSIVLSDFNGHGRLDLVVTNHGSNSVSVLINQPPR